MLNKIILASKSKVRKNILDKHNIFCEVKPSNVDEDVVKESLINELASPEIISKPFVLAFRITMGCKSPCFFMLSANSSIAVVSKSILG